MRFPALIVKKGKVLANACKVVEMCTRRNIAVWGVTKGMSGDPRLAKIYQNAGMAGIADSRLSNLKKIKDAGVSATRMLIRIPMRSELEELVEYAGVSLQSDISVIQALDAICAKRSRTHDAIVMVDVGDLREGFWPDELGTLAASLKKLKGGVRVVGVGANFACASGVLPSAKNLRQLVVHRDMLQEGLGREIPTISVGGTCCLQIMENSDFPREINQVRLGESAILGMDTAFSRAIPYLENNTMELRAEILECRFKPSVPVGEAGLDAFGRRVEFEDRGMRKRALLGIGKQDVHIDKLVPLQEGVEIVTASSDHMIVDVTEADARKPADAGYKAGDILTFRPRYPAMLAATTSGYVEVRFE